MNPCCLFLGDRGSWISVLIKSMQKKSIKFLFSSISLCLINTFAGPLDSPQPKDLGDASNLCGINCLYAVSLMLKANISYLDIYHSFPRYSEEGTSLDELHSFLSRRGIKSHFALITEKEFISSGFDLAICLNENGKRFHFTLLHSNQTGGLNDIDPTSFVISRLPHDVPRKAMLIIEEKSQLPLMMSTSAASKTKEAKFDFDFFPNNLLLPVLNLQSENYTEVSGDFEIKNNSNDDLLIQRVLISCNCTRIVPMVPRVIPARKSINLKAVVSLHGTTKLIRHQQTEVIFSIKNPRTGEIANRGFSVNAVTSPSFIVHPMVCYRRSDDKFVRISILLPSDCDTNRLAYESDGLPVFIETKNIIKENISNNVISITQEFPVSNATRLIKIKYPGFGEFKIPIHTKPNF